MRLSSCPFIRRSIHLIWIAVLFLFTSNYMLNRIRHACRRTDLCHNEIKKCRRTPTRMLHTALSVTSLIRHIKPQSMNLMRSVPIVFAGVQRFRSDSRMECQLPGSGLASQRNRGENQINLSLLTVVGFDPIWELATHSILFVFTWRMHTEGQALGQGYVWKKEKDGRKKEGIKERAVWSKQLFVLGASSSRGRDTNCK